MNGSLGLNSKSFGSETVKFSYFCSSFSKYEELNKEYETLIQMLEALELQRIKQKQPDTHNLSKKRKLSSSESVVPIPNGISKTPQVSNPVVVSTPPPKATPQAGSVFNVAPTPSPKASATPQVGNMFAGSRNKDTPQHGNLFIGSKTTQSGSLFSNFKTPPGNLYTGSIYSKSNHTPTSNSTSTTIAETTPTPTIPTPAPTPKPASTNKLSYSTSSISVSTSSSTTSQIGTSIPSGSSSHSFSSSTLSSSTSLLSSSQPSLAVSSSPVSPPIIVRDQPVTVNDLISSRSIEKTKTHRTVDFSMTHSLLNSASFDELSMSLKKEQLAEQLAQLEEVICDLKLLVNDPQSFTLALEIDQSRFTKTTTNDAEFNKNVQIYSRRLRNAFFSTKSTNHNRYFKAPGSSVIKPFLNQNSLKRLKTKHLNLPSGTLLHVPFSPEEEDIVVSMGTSFTTAKLEELAQKLPGRTMSDCINYLNTVNSCVRKEVTEEQFNDYLVHDVKEKKPQTHSLYKLVKERQWNSQYCYNMTKQRDSAMKARLRNFEIAAVSTGPSNAVVDVKFHPLGFTKGPNEALLYDLKTGAFKPLDGHNNTVSDTTFSIDGEKVITASYDCNLKVWNSNDGSLLHTLGKTGANSIGHEGPVYRIALHSIQPNIIASCAKDKSLILWNIETGEALVDLSKISFEPKSIKPSFPAPLVDVDFGKELFEHYMICGSESINRVGELQVWDINTRQVMYLVEKYRAALSCLKVSPSGSTFVIGSADRNVYTFDMKTGKRIHTFPTLLPLGQDLNVVSFSPCERYIQCAGEDNRVIVYDSRFSARPVHVLAHEKFSQENVTAQGVSSSQWTHFGSYLVTGGEDYVVRVWDIKSGDPLIKSLKGHGGPVSSVAISLDDSVIASGGDETQVLLYSDSTRFSLK